MKKQQQKNQQIETKNKNKQQQSINKDNNNEHFTTATASATAAATATATETATTATTASITVRWSCARAHCRLCVAEQYYEFLNISPSYESYEIFGLSLGIFVPCWSHPKTNPEWLPHAHRGAGKGVTGLAGLRTGDPS